MPYVNWNVTLSNPQITFTTSPGPVIATYDIKSGGAGTPFNGAVIGGGPIDSLIISAATMGSNVPTTDDTSPNNIYLRRVVFRLKVVTNDASRTQVLPLLDRNLRLDEQRTYLEVELTHNATHNTWTLNTPLRLALGNTSLGTGLQPSTSYLLIGDMVGLWRDQSNTIEVRRNLNPEDIASFTTSAGFT